MPIKIKLKAENETQAAMQDAKVALSELKGTHGIITEEQIDTAVEFADKVRSEDDLDVVLQEMWPKVPRIFLHLLDPGVL